MRWALLCVLVGVIFMPSASVTTQAKYLVWRDHLWVMSYNVHNLFDAKHDTGKLDGSYLPLKHPKKEELCHQESRRFWRSCLATDWTEEKVTLKLSQMKRLFEIMGTPDILALQEVENEAILKRLAQVLGYSYYVFFEGHDRRGIDTALLYKDQHVELLDSVSRAPYGENFGRPTRNILAAFFRVRNTGDTMGVYVNHWPSQASDTEKRVHVSQHLSEFMAEDQKNWGPDLHAVVLGDFNTLDDEQPHPIRSVLMEKSPLALRDTLDWHQKSGDRHFPLGTYFYPPLMEWNYLDRILVSKNLLDSRGLEADPNSLYVHVNEENSSTYTYSHHRSFNRGSVIIGVPKRFNARTLRPEKAGYSDHFPISIRVRF